MKIYAHYGFKDFVLCLGYKGEMIKEYFRNYLWNTCDTTLYLGRDPEAKFHTRHTEEDWSVTLADTGENSMTAFRIHRIRKYIGPDIEFLLTYGDGVGNINVPASIDFHHAARKLCTLTAVNPPGRFGELGLDANGIVHGFNEKPQAEGGYINGGYMICNSRIFDYLDENPATMFEQEPMQRLTADCQLAAFKHHGFWQPMDTFQEFNLLNEMWAGGKAPWKVW
jgi:glucose-1-phosphate cytidylyltransferase